ncbi:FAD-dependent oxidoreductase [Ornithinibacillus sp. BX22]|uniref:FAD-dependent oxidoreductase n=1 Tax=Ornithinibacillus hominis TaxID=2763055 RepID=A0A923L5Q8_9BACI|nr:FAD-dependent oxidoreductase [Ornithinibacillus hominis]MBC5637008.1 FAD-dependent oxidoreductase [Ornithinibacillus hominis]
MAQSKELPQFPEPFWREIDIPNYPKLVEGMKVDVGIVGGGIVGITTAYLLAKQNVTVALLDAGRILNGTTGHTTAKITAQHGLIYDEFIQHFGEEKAKLYYEAQMEAKEFVEATAKELDINCDLEEQDAIIYTNSDDYVNQLETEKKAYDTLGIDSELTDSIPLKVQHKLALIMKNQAQFHPLKFLSVLAKEAVKHGAQIFENTTAVDVEYNKHPAIITREGHRVICGNIFVASHFPFYDGQGFYPARMYAERAYVLAIKSKKNYPGGMYITAEEPTRSLRSITINGEEAWLVIGDNHKTGQGKSTIEHYKALQDFAEAHIGVEEILYRWSAQDLTTLDKLPYIGRISEEEDKIFVATGFRKWGMSNGILAAKIISDKILGHENPYTELFSPSRFQTDPSLRKFARINADVAKHLIKGKLEFTDNSIKSLSKDDATVTRINGKRAGVYKDPEDKYHCVDTTCTHMGCEVEWNSGERTWDCPCHGSRFSYTGEVVEGPAKRPLERIDLE